MKYEFLKAEEVAGLRQEETWFLRNMLEANIELLNTLAESPEGECEEVGLRFINAKFPKELRETVTALEEELNRRRVSRQR